MSDTDQQQDQNDQRDAVRDDHTQVSDNAQQRSSKDDTIAKISEERREARERARKAEERLAELEAKQREADEAKAKEEGRYKELLEQREAELKQTSESLTTVQAERDALLELVKADVDAKWDDLPEEVKDAYDGEADDPLAKRKHMQRMAKVIERLTAASEHKPGNGPNPPPADNKRDLKAAEQQARRRYTV